jgi:1-acyl-sn-glycerol-3-phosphate acyltransferase
MPASSRPSLLSVARSLLTYAFWLVMVPICALLGFPWTFLSGKIDFLYKFGCWVAIAGVRIAGIRPQVVGREGLEQGTFIFMSNHVSNLDPPMLIPLIPRRTSVLAKKELFRIPILGRGFLMGSFVPVDRNNREAAKASLRTAAEVLHAGINLTIFPEGTRSPNGRLLPFKKGPFFLAKDTGVPVVPVTIVNTESLWPKGSMWMRQGVASIVFHAPLNPADYASRDALMEAVRESILSALPPERRG